MPRRFISATVARAAAGPTPRRARSARGTRPAPTRARARCRAAAAARTARRSPDRSAGAAAALVLHDAVLGHVTPLRVGERAERCVDRRAGSASTSVERRRSRCARADSAPMRCSAAAETRAPKSLSTRRRIGDAGSRRDLHADVAAERSADPVDLAHVESRDAAPPSRRDRAACRSPPDAASQLAAPAAGKVGRRRRACRARPGAARGSRSRGCCA